MRKITCHHQSSVHGVVVHHVERPTRPEPLVHGGRLPVQHPASSAGKWWGDGGGGGGGGSGSGGGGYSGGGGGGGGGRTGEREIKKAKLISQELPPHSVNLSMDFIMGNFFP